jgi:hypothetical protein
MINPEEVIQVREWYSGDLSRKELKPFLKRDHYHAILDFFNLKSGFIAVKNLILHLAIATHSWLPLLFFGLPRFYGRFFSGRLSGYSILGLQRTFGTID